MFIMHRSAVVVVALVDPQGHLGFLFLDDNAMH